MKPGSKEQRDTHGDNGTQSNKRRITAQMLIYKQYRMQAREEKINHA